MVRVSDTRRNSMRFGAWLVLATVVAVGALGWQSWRAGDFISLWLTPDQQGRLEYENLEFNDAYERFEDPAWKGVAGYDSGLYLESADAFGRIPTAEGFFNRGNAFMKGREYRKAIVAYEEAVAEAPEWLEARENLDLATYTLDYLERAREDADPGKASVGADDVVFDNTEKRGAEIEVTGESKVEIQSAEKWMRSVNTDTRDFLHTRFMLEASRRGSL